MILEFDATISRLRERKRVTDPEFDAIFCLTYRAVSQRFWTPVDVACTAAEWLTHGGADRVLDVGSGAGKLCIVGALWTKAHFHGIEHRHALVRAARAAATCAGVDERTSFEHAAVTGPLLREFKAWYLFNPFGENLFQGESRLDSRVPLSKERFLRDVGVIEQGLTELPPRARVVTYHGFGGLIPDSFSMLREERIGGDFLRLWVQTKDVPRGWFAERADGVVHLPDR